MDYQTLKMNLYPLNDDELFYKRYYFAKQQEYSLSKFLSELDLKDVKQRNLIVPEIKDTIPPKFEDSFFFDIHDDKSIVVQKHNRYSPPITHSHTFFELIYVYDGTCEQYVEGKEFQLKSGDICIIPPNISHSITVFDESIIINVLIRKNTFHNVFFNFTRTESSLSSFFINNIYSKNGNDYIIYHTGSDDAIADSFIYMLLESTNKEIYYYEMISQTLMLTFGLLVRNYEKTIELPTFKKKSDVQRFALLQYIQENSASISLDSVADHFHYTPEYTSKLIKQTTGKTFTEIIQQLRIERAQVLLKDTNLTVSNISQKVGYDTTEHFIRVFKKNIHLTPTQYRHYGEQL
ncbi:two-component response regulator yesN [Lachnospiraceae bacterium KM106-2]|nr:two-component response regulator yesN [Lachnospiraceae bacterium KM106-2]